MKQKTIATRHLRTKIAAGYVLILFVISRADGYVPTRLMYRLICNLPEYSIRIFNPLASYCYLIGMNCGSQILILHAVG